MRILLAEDEPAIADFVRAGLCEQGYAVDVTTDGSEALEWPHLADFDLIILDVMLPGLEGTEVCRRWRLQGLTTPVLMLTARDSVEDRVRGLDSGADDYLVKPFAFSELLARLRALLRRPAQVTGRELALGDLRLDTVTREVTRAGQPVLLTSKEHALLEYFLRRPQQVLSRAQIAEHVWSYEFDSTTNVIDVHVRNLRRKLGEPGLIHTVRGAGYRLAPA